MTLSAQQKGKGKPLPQDSVESAEFPSPLSPLSASSSPSSSSHSSLDSSSESESEEEDSSEDEDDVSQEYLDLLLEKARRSIASRATQNTVANKGDVLEEDIIGLDDPETELKYVILYPFPSYPLEFYSRSLPPLDPGTLPPSYITLGKTQNDAPLAVRDLDAERVMELASSLAAPAPPVPPPELTKSGKPLTKKEKKAVGPRSFCRCPTTLILSSVEGKNRWTKMV